MSRAADFIVRALGAAVVTVGVMACVADTPPDSDGAPGLARDLEVDVSKRDRLECGRNDCSDWYRIYVSEPGTLRLYAESDDPLGVSGIELVIGDDRAEPLDRTRWIRRGSLSREVEKGYYFVRVSTRVRDPVAYVMRASFERRAVPVPKPRLKPRPAKPRTTSVSGQVVEVEGQGGRIETILFRVENSGRLRTGLKGRLVQGGNVIGELEVTEIYSGGGARGRLLGPLRERVDSTTKVLIDVPIRSR